MLVQGTDVKPVMVSPRPVPIQPPAEAPGFAPVHAADIADAERRTPEQRAEEALRPLDPWKRYRALVDAIDEGHQILEIADRKTRFALLIMGALNVFAFLLVTRPEMLLVVPAGLRGWLGGYVVVYALLAIFFLLQAIEALRPRVFDVRPGDTGGAGPLHSPLRLRYYEYAVDRDVEAHGRAWQEVCLSQLNAELAVQHHVLARTNQHKYAALRRLYAGLYLLTLMSGVLIAVLALLGAAGGARREGQGFRLLSPGAATVRPLVVGSVVGSRPTP
jgi:hypothetical protein